MTGLLTRLLPDRPELRASVGPTVHPSESATWLQDLLGGGVSSAGRRVTANNALTIGALYAGMRLLGSSVGQLPLHVLRREEDGRRTQLRSHRLWSLLNDAPNEWITAIEYRELMTAWALLHGNALTLLDLTQGGSIESMIPLDPTRVQYWLTPDERSLVYEYKTKQGRSVFLPRDQVLHLRAPLGNQWVGLGLLSIAKDTLGLAMVAEEHASRFYSNAAAPAGVLITPKTLKGPAWERVKTQWNARHQGAENAFKTAILEDGLEWKPMSLNLKDQQFLETRTFQVQEVARWIGIPPHLIGELSRSTNNNIEAQGIEFVSFAIGPWCVRWEQRIKLDCLGPNERRSVYVKHRADAFLRGQTLDRYRAYQIGRQAGFLSPNDIRRSEDLDPIENGDDYMAPLNMVPLSDFGGDTTDPGTDNGTDTGDGTGNPPTVAGGTRTATIDRATRTMTLAVTPLMHDAVQRATRRATGTWDKLLLRSATPDANDVDQHRQWCARTVEPIARAFATGLLGAAEVDADVDRIAVVARHATNAVVEEWSNAFRQARPAEDQHQVVMVRSLSMIAQLVSSQVHLYSPFTSES